MALSAADQRIEIEAARKAKAQGYDKLDAISPYPLHDIDGVLGIPRSFIPWVTFVMGLSGCTFGVWFTWWTHSVNWQLIIGGKPYFAFPAYIPIVFECTILFGALSSVAAMFFLNGLPSVDPPVIDPDLTSHKFALYVPEDDKQYNEEKLKSLFKELGAEEVKVAEY